MTTHQGQKIDEFYESEQKPAEYHILASLQAHFDYLECQGCGKIIPTFQLDPEEVKQWKFELMGLRPGILLVAKGTCPICQKLFSQFSKVL
jgi:hypothetical protein